MRAWFPLSLGVVLAGCQSTTSAPAVVSNVPVQVSVAVGGIT